MARRKARCTPVRRSAKFASRLLQKQAEREANSDGEEGVSSSDDSAIDDDGVREQDGNSGSSNNRKFSIDSKRAERTIRELKDLANNSTCDVGGDVILTGSSGANKTISSKGKSKAYLPRSGKLLKGKAPINHFMKQYSLLQTTLRASRRLKIELKGGQYDPEKDDPVDTYSFLTYATKRFIVALSHIIQESQPEFSLAKWDTKRLGQLGRGHSTSRSESASAVVYLESLFGKVPVGTHSSLFDVPVHKPIPEDTPSSEEVKNIRIESRVANPLGSEDCNRPKVIIGNKEFDISALTAPRQNNFKKIEKVNHEEAHDNDNDGDAGCYDDDVVDDCEVNNSDATKDITSLICVLCHKRKFPDIKSFVRHYQEVHHQSDILEFWLSMDLCSAVMTAKQKKEQLSGNRKESYIKCGLCSFHLLEKNEEDGECLDQAVMISRYVSHYIELHHPKYKCDHCRKLFSFEPILELHVRHCTQAIEQCGFQQPTEKADVFYYMKKRCGLHKVDFTDEFLYADHMCKFHIHEVDGGEMAQILGLSVKQLLAERNSMLGIQYVCHMCGREKGTFENPSDWIDHVHDAHPGRVICEVCCQFVGSLKQHTKNAHGTFGESYFLCLKNYCKYRGAGFPSVFQHVRNFHPDIDLEQPIEFRRKCADCDYIICYSYNKKLLDYGKPTRKLFTHYGTTHDKKFCEKCGNFYSRKYYETHLESHDAEETGVKKYTCGICSQKFLHKDTLKDHERRHDEKNRTHMCHLCSKSFFFRGDLNTHIKMVHQEKSLHCAKCNKSFALANHLRQHQKRCGNPDYQMYSQTAQAPKRKSPMVEHEAPMAKMDRTIRSQIEANIETLNRETDVKMPLTDDMKFSILTPVTDIAATSQIIAHAHSATTNAGLSRPIEQHEPHNMTMSGANALNYYQGEQPLSLAYDDVYRVNHSLGMMLPSFNIPGQMGYAPQQHHPQHN